MCFGSKKRQHHAEQERMRAETLMRNIQEQAERDRQAALERMEAMQVAAEQRQQVALRAIAESSKQPIRVKTTADATTPLLKIKQKQTPSGLSSLRIKRTPGTNIAGGLSGPNIG